MINARILGQLFAFAVVIGWAFSGSAQVSADDRAALRSLDRHPDGSPILNLIAPDGSREVLQIAFVDEAGEKRSLADYHGTPAVVHFWATWCFPCRDEMPTVDALQRALGDDIVVLPLSVGRDGAETLRAYYQDHGLKTLPVMIDEKMKTARALKVNGIPTTIFVDGNGTEVARVLGERDWGDPAAVDLVRRIAQ